jgi:hypothetical protein
VMGLQAGALSQLFEFSPWFYTKLRRTRGI